jgi:hypothetical protein
MSIKIYRLNFLILTLIFLHTATFTQGNSTAVFLKSEIGNINSSMGGLLNSGNYNDMFYNPWYLGFSVNYGISFSKWAGFLEGSEYNFLSVVLPRSKVGTFGLYYFSYNAGYETFEEFSGEEKKINLEDNKVVSVAYGINLGEKLSLGCNVKYLYSVLAEEYIGQSFVFDTGLLFHSLDDRHIIGIAVKNFGQQIRYRDVLENLPTIVSLGYCFNFKPLDSHRVSLGISSQKELYESKNIVSCGISYSPFTQLISIRGGLSYDWDKISYATGFGLSFWGFDLNFCYQISQKYSNVLPLRLSVSKIFGPTDDYHRGEKYLKYGFRRKAVSIWKNILPGEKYYAEAKKAIRINMLPPELIVQTVIKDENNDGIFSASESGGVEVKITNKGKSEAVDLRLSVDLLNFKDYQIVDIGYYPRFIQILEPGKETSIFIPIKVNEETKDVEKIPMRIEIIEGRGFNPNPVELYIPIKPFSPPVPVFAKYTFREDNSGYSIGNGNGIIENGEQIEITGYIVNAGENEAKNLVVEIVSLSEKIKVLPETSKFELGNLKPHEYKKISFAFEISKNYTESEKIPILIKFNEERSRFNRIQKIDLCLNRFYLAPIEIMSTEDSVIVPLDLLPQLPGPVIGQKAKQIIQSWPDQPPILEFNAVLFPDDNKNNVYEPYEKLILQVQIRNTGLGKADNVKIILSGDNTVSSLLGKEIKVGNIFPGESKTVLSESVIPEDIPRKEAKFIIKIEEGKGFSPTTLIEKRVAFMPKEVKVVKDLPKIVPWPEAYKNQRTNAGAIVIGITDYQYIDGPKYAATDAELVYHYLNGVLGVPEKNIKKLINKDATKGKIESSLKDWLAKKEFNLIVFYFAGHGVPDPENPRTGEPYIVPVDGSPQEGKYSLVALNEVVSSLENTEAENVIIILDACFSGSGGRTPQQFAKAQRGIGIQPKIQQKRSVILSATTDIQPAFEFDKVGHGYFTYYLLLGLKGEADKDNDGWIDLVELYNFVKENLTSELDGKQVPSCSNLIPLKLGKYK